MASRKDQLHSYQFMLQRAISALIMRETDPAQSPLRRGVGAAFIGVMVTVIVAAAFGIYGLLTKTGSNRWQFDNAVVVEKETGATFVYLGGGLTPTVNLASALLISGQGASKTFTVPRNSLTDVPRGRPVGIVGAPSSLPDTKHLLTGAWAACRLPAEDAAGQATVATALLVGRVAAGGTPVGDRSLYVRGRTAEGEPAEYLVWHGHRYRLTAPKAVAALFTSGTSPVDVGSAWLNTLPEGDPIGRIAVPKAGDPSTKVPRRTVGDVGVDRRDGSETFYLVADDGLARLTPLQMDLLKSERAVTPVEIPPSEIAAVPVSKRLASTSPTAQRAPERRPTPLEVPAEGSVCATFDAAGDVAPSLAVSSGEGADTGAIVTAKQTTDGAMLADRVSVPPGRAAVVRDRESGTYSLVTDQGKRFPVESGDALAALGYTDADAVSMPRALLGRIPTGPALTRADAVTPVG
ncbi:type VII secretion protein EccB [Cryptosporangium japonicum]|uniref:Type VII secretion protein EccB n=1 Tax=Cryptosporangium japonicum TaxID=80872 RepID=A0ABP3EY58_9ACTN